MVLNGFRVGLDLWKASRARWEPIRAAQWVKQQNLRDRLHNVEHHVTTAREELISRPLPDEQVRAVLLDLQRFLLRHKDEFIAPTPEQLERLASTVKDALLTWEESEQTPLDDSILTEEGELRERGWLSDDLLAVSQQVRFMIDHINLVERKPMGLRKQARLFAKDYDRLTAKAGSTVTAPGLRTA